MSIQFSVDKFHESNHTSCGKTFNSSEYVSLRDKNSQACEQVNAKLRTIATTCTFMNPDMFMRSISLYLSYQNTKNSEWSSCRQTFDLFKCFICNKCFFEICELWYTFRWESPSFREYSLMGALSLVSFPALFVVLFLVLFCESAFLRIFSSTFSSTFPSTPLQESFFWYFLEYFFE